MNLYIRDTMDEVIAKLKELAEKEKSLNITTDSDQANQRQYYLAFILKIILKKITNVKINFKAYFLNYIKKEIIKPMEKEIKNTVFTFLDFMNDKEVLEKMVLTRDSKKKIFKLLGELEENKISEEKNKIFINIEKAILDAIDNTRFIFFTRRKSKSNR